MKYILLQVQELNEKINNMTTILSRDEKKNENTNNKIQLDINQNDKKIKKDDIKIFDQCTRSEKEIIEDKINIIYKKDEKENKNENVKKVEIFNINKNVNKNENNNNKVKNNNEEEDKEKDKDEENEDEESEESEDMKNDIENILKKYFHKENGDLNKEEATDNELKRIEEYYKSLLGKNKSILDIKIYQNEYILNKINPQLEIIEDHSHKDHLQNRLNIFKHDDY
jgi:hypothetical protein